MVSTTEVWNQFLNKYVIVTKRVNGSDYFYRGILVSVNEDSIEIDERAVKVVKNEPLVTLSDAFLLLVALVLLVLHQLLF